MKRVTFIIAVVLQLFANTQQAATGRFEHDKKVGQGVKRLPACRLAATGIEGGHYVSPVSPSAEALRSILRNLPKTGWTEGFYLYNSLYAIYEAHVLNFSKADDVVVNIEAIHPIVKFCDFREWGGYSEIELARLHYLAYALPCILSTLHVIESLQPMCEPGRSSRYEHWTRCSAKAQSFLRFVKEDFLGLTDVDADGVQALFPLLFAESDQVRIACSQIVAALSEFPQAQDLIADKLDEASSKVISVAVRVNAKKLAAERERMTFLTKGLSSVSSGAKKMNELIKKHNVAVQVTRVSFLIDPIPEVKEALSLDAALIWGGKNLVLLGEHLHPWEVEVISDLFMSGDKFFILRTPGSSAQRWLQLLLKLPCRKYLLDITKQLAVQAKSDGTDQPWEIA